MTCIEISKYLFAEIYHSIFFKFIHFERWIKVKRSHEETHDKSDLIFLLLFQKGSKQFIFCSIEVLAIENNLTGQYHKCNKAS